MYVDKSFHSKIYRFGSGNSESNAPLSKVVIPKPKPQPSPPPIPPAPKTSYTSTPDATGTLLYLPGIYQVTVKLWGASGASGYFSGAFGGGGGYTEYKFTSKIGKSYYISVGKAGLFGVPTTSQILSGGNGFVGDEFTMQSAGGGSASCLFEYENNTYTLMAVAGGGGGGGSSGDGYATGGAGGGNSGQSGSGQSYHPPPGTGGSNGIGGVGFQGNGQNCSLTSLNITDFGGKGADGKFVVETYSLVSAGGGGYGGGGTTDGAGSGGGGGFVNSGITGYISGNTIMGNSYTPPNTEDMDYINNAGLGPTTTESDGNDGLIVVIIN